MKKIIFIGIAASLFTACGIYKPYTRPEVNTAGLYGTAQSMRQPTLHPLPTSGGASYSPTDCCND